MAASSKSEKSKASEKKVFDVAKPGKSAPSTTTRPVIVGHKPMIQDPMVNQADTETNQENKTTSAHSVKKIMPLDEEPAATDDKNKQSAKPVAATTSIANAAPKKVDEPQPEKPSETKPSEEPSESDEEVATTDQTAAVDALANQAVKKKEGQLTEEEKKRTEAINKLIEDKTYFLRIGQAHRRRNNSVLAVTALLFAVLVGLILAIDAGLLQTDITLPFDLIAN